MDYLVSRMPSRYVFADFAQASQAKLIPTQVSFGQTNVSVVTAGITDGVWPLSNDSAVYLDGSGQIGQQGNAVIYGHDTNKVFSKLKKLVPGDVITLATQQGDQFHYQVELSQSVTPDQTHILAPTTDERLTLYTCEGIFSQKRRVLVATRLIR